jgi:hypothetical protein
VRAVRASLVVTNLVGAAVGFVWVEILLYRLDTSPDVESAVLGALWLGFPYLAAAALAGLARRHGAAQVTLLVTLVVAGGIGLYLLTVATVEHERSHHEVVTAVHPGEDPHRGAAGMRKSGAEMSEFFTGALSLFLCVVVPPVQLAAIVVPTLIAWVVSALARGRDAASARTAAPQ